MADRFYDNLMGFSDLKYADGVLYGRLNGGEYQVIPTAGADGEDGIDGVNAYLYVAYASDDQGTAFSLIPAANLTYIALLQSATQISNPIASQFAGKWQKYIGADGLDAYVYVAYASDASGTAFNMTPSDSLKYRAEIHVTAPIASPSLSDFTGATWVKYIGDDGQNLVSSVNSKTGDVVLDAEDVGAATSDHTHTAYSLTTHDHSGVYSSVGHNHDSAYSLTTHNHDTVYSQLGHTHSDYSLTTHTHDYTAVFAAIDHTHSSYSLTTHDHDSTYAAISHTHSGYASSTHNHDGTYVPVTTGYSLVADTEITRLASVSNYDDTAITAALSGKADISALSDYSLTTHNHNGVYAAISHTHDYTSVFSAIDHNHDDDYVAVVSGKGLSTEDYTSAEKTKLSGIEAGAEVNVNADWNATSGDAQILNKPTIPDAQIQADWTQTTDTAKDYIKNKPTIPAAQVQSDWNATSGMGQILNKPTIPSKTSDLTNDSGFTTDSAVASGYVAKATGYSLVADAQITKLGNLPTITSIGTGLSLTDGVLSATGGNSVPPGCVLPFAGAGDVPSGFLLCNGAAVSRTTYADLFTALGTTYGVGDGSTTFNIPDFRGRFLRGYDGTRSAAIGTPQNDGLPNITGTIVTNAGGEYSAFGEAILSSRTGALDVTTRTQQAISGSTSVSLTSIAGITFNASDSNSIYGNSSYVTPYNYAVQFIIKY
jgi:microcystin-dependent protein